MLKEEIQKRDVEVYDTAYASAVASRVNSETKCGVCRSFTLRLGSSHDIPGRRCKGLRDQEQDSILHVPMVMTPKHESNIFSQLCN